MASFDIVSEVDLQTVDNAVNAAKKEIETRFDFKGTNSEIELDKKNLVIHFTTENDFRIDQMEKVLIGRFVKAKIDPMSLDLSKDFYQYMISAQKALNAEDAGFLAEPVMIHSNVENGIGILGSYNTYRFTTEVESYSPFFD